MTDDSDTPSEEDRTTRDPVDPTSGGALGCRPSLEELFRYMDGALDDDRIAHMRSHLDACGGCGELYHFQTGLRHLIEMRCRSELPPDLANRVFRAITDLR
jgi:mycothiol system anti-sigma-R factor